MIVEAGVLEGVERCIALHVWPELAAGAIGIHRSYVMAASTHFRVVFHGRPGHQSQPHAAADAIMMAAHWMMDMKTFMSTAVDPSSQAVLAFGNCRREPRQTRLRTDAKSAETYRAFEPDVVNMDPRGHRATLARRSPPCTAEAPNPCSAWARR